MYCTEFCHACYVYCCQAHTNLPVVHGREVRQLGYCVGLEMYPFSLLCCTVIIVLL